MISTSKSNIPKTLEEFDRLLPDEPACRTYLVASRWPKGVCCPSCGNERVYSLTTRPFHWVCKAKAHKHSYRFSLTVGTVFENTNYPIRTWFRVLYLMSAKKGMSALQIHRLIGSGSYQTTWYLVRRLRAGLADPEFRRLVGAFGRMARRYGPKITYFFCRPCCAYHAQPHPHYRAAKRRADRRRQLKSPE